MNLTKLSPYEYFAVKGPAFSLLPLLLEALSATAFSARTNPLPPASSSNAILPDLDDLDDGDSEDLDLDLDVDDLDD